MSIKQAKVNPFNSLTSEEKLRFLTELPSLLSGWFYGVAMNSKFNVDTASRTFSISWGTKAYREFLDWLVFFSRTLTHKPTVLYRLVSTKPGVRLTSKLKPSKNVIHSWAPNPKVCQELYTFAYKKLDTGHRQYVIVKTTMPAANIAITHLEVVKLTNWVIKNLDNLITQLSSEQQASPLYSVKNILSVWNDLNKRINTSLIKSQKEYVCIGSNPLPVEIVYSYP